MSGSKITIADEDRLDNVHPGDILREDFMIGTEISVADVVQGSGVRRKVLEQLLRSEGTVDAETGLRLARYFGMSDEFFVGLQLDYDVEEAKRAKGDEIARIERRAA